MKQTTKQQKITRHKWKSESEKEGIKISRTLRDIIHGYIMSDGYVSVGGGIQVDQSKKQAKFVEWLYDELSPLCTDSSSSSLSHHQRGTKGKPALGCEAKGEVGIKVKSRIDKRSGNATESSSFQTRNLAKGFRRMWYESYTDEKGRIKNRKVLPKSLPCFFNSTFLTLWFAGDGTKMKGQRGAKFEATAFTPSDRKRLQHLFKAKFDINVQINRAGVSRSGTEQWTININSPEYDKFRSLITEIDLIPSLFPDKLHPKKP